MVSDFILNVASAGLEHTCSFAARTPVGHKDVPHLPWEVRTWPPTFSILDSWVKKIRGEATLLRNGGGGVGEQWGPGMFTVLAQTPQR